MRVYLESVGLYGPGLDGWAASRPIFAGLAEYVPAPTVIPPSRLLPSNERRRAAPAVKIALAVGDEALAQESPDRRRGATVFASSGGDPDTIHSIIETLTSSERDVSPTRFHNSVHNAPSGYWTIAMQSHESSTSIACHDTSVAAGLLEGAVQAIVDDKVVTVIGYELPYPNPLAAVRPVNEAFGVAFVLAPRASQHSLSRLNIEILQATASASRMADSGLEKLRKTNPAAQCLPILSAIARKSSETIVLDYTHGGQLSVSVSPVQSKPRASDSSHDRAERTWN